jgi:hypothetical protein
LVSVTDATRKLVRSSASRRGDCDATAYVERDGANRAHRHHIQEHLVLVLVAIQLFSPTLLRRVIIIIIIIIFG